MDVVIGADGANSRVAKDIDAGEYDYAIAFQVGSLGGLEESMASPHVGNGERVLFCRIGWPRPGRGPVPRASIALALPALQPACLDPCLFAAAPQERIRIPEDKMEYYKDLAEM